MRLPVVRKYSIAAFAAHVSPTLWLDNRVDDPYERFCLRFIINQALHPVNLNDELSVASLFIADLLPQLLLQLRIFGAVAPPPL